jgi:nicotinamidase/pyrazinamidase
VKSIFLMDVDTQKDFILSSGACHLPGAERLIPKFRRLFEFARNNGLSIISTAEIHQAGEPEFRQFPPHCLQDSDGQKKLDDTLLPRPFVVANKPFDRNLLELVQKHQQIIIQKQQFDVFTNPAMERLLRVLPQHAIVFGVMAEHAVRCACLGLRRSGVKTVVVGDAVRGMTPQAERDAFEELRGAGVDFTTLEALLGVLQGDLSRPPRR